MRQVPHYLIIGNGRVAKHFKNYFSLLSFSFSTWCRQQPLDLLNEQLKSATHVLVLIKDAAIEPFIQKNLQTTSAVLLHFSGSIVSDQAFGAHPLLTFNEHLYDLQTYQAIPFIIDHDAPEFAELFPGLTNPAYRLHKSLKPKYHALCVLSGNFSCLLWQKLFKTLEEDFAIPRTAAHLYLQQQTKNLLLHPEQALTGPLVRNDEITIQNNINALADDGYQQVYKSFVKSYNAGDKK